MDFMLVLYESDAVPADGSGMAAMGKFAGELSQQGKLKGGAPLHSSKDGVRVRVDGGKPIVTDGPFTETKEIVGGYFLIECESRDEAVEIAKRCPLAQWGGIVEVRQQMDMKAG